MRKLLLSFLMISFTIVATAQQDTLQQTKDSLQQYTGKYKFPEGTPFPEVVVTLDNGTLVGTSILGMAEFKKIEKDVFEIVGYGGTATFKRNAEKKIVSLLVLVSDIDATGTREEEGKLTLAENKRE